MREKVTFYMKSGNTIICKFKGFETDKLSESKGTRSMQWDKIYSHAVLTIDVGEIEAITIKRVLW